MILSHLAQCRNQDLISASSSLPLSIFSSELCFEEESSVENYPVWQDDTLLYFKKSIGIHRVPFIAQLKCFDAEIL